MLCAKCRFAPSLDLFGAKSEDGTNSHFAHNMSYQMYGAVCSIQTHKWVVMVILVRERRRRGGAGLGMGDVLGCVVTLDVTVGGAERVAR